VDAVTVVLEDADDAGLERVEVPPVEFAFAPGRADEDAVLFFVLVVVLPGLVVLFDVRFAGVVLETSVDVEVDTRVLLVEELVVLVELEFAFTCFDGVA
jgi:hypothetical protein